MQIKLYKAENKESLKELIKPLELVNELAILENSNLDSLVNKVRKKSKNLVCSYYYILFFNQTKKLYVKENKITKISSQI